MINLKNILGLHNLGLNNDNSSTSIVTTPTADHGFLPFNSNPVITPNLMGKLNNKLSSSNLIMEGAISKFVKRLLTSSSF